MKVLVVVEPGFAGVFRQVEGLVHYLIRKGVSVSLAYSDRRPSPGLQILVNEVLQHGGQVLNLRTINRPTPSDLVTLWNLSKFIARTKPDVIHAHSSKAGALVRILTAFSAKRPVFYTPNAYYGMGRSGFLAAFFNLLERWLAPYGITINISPDEAMFARNVLGALGTPRIIPNPVLVEHFTPATPEQKRAARRSLGFPEEGIILGTSGRLVFQKDPMSALKALEPLLQDQDDLFFAVLGEGKLRLALDEEARLAGVSSKIIHLNYLEEALPFYHAIDGFLLTSRYEAGIPFVLLEAASCGLPLVTTLSPGLSDLPRLGLSDCWTAGVGDVPALRDEIEVMIAEIRSHPEGVRTNHRSLIEKQFSHEACYTPVLEEYRKALEG
jgi:glycosyltransferase involved in cell wall biosynthesis